MATRRLKEKISKTNTQTKFICMKCNSNKSFRTIETQTDFSEVNELSQASRDEKTQVILKKTNNFEHTLPLRKRKYDNGIEKANNEEKEIECKEQVLEKPRRKRKRKTCEPKGVKTSATFYIQQQKQMKQTQPLISFSASIPIRENEDEAPDIFDQNLEIIEVENCFGQDRKVAGYLPIHDAIANNLSLKFNECLKFWVSKKNIDLNNCELLLTDDDQDCLQLAVLYDCLPDIVRKLLDANFSTETFDADSNNIIHLAILSDIQLASFDLLLSRIRWEILLERNDQGYTCLHLAVHENRFLHAERILNKMDQIFQNEIFYQFQENISEPDANQQIDEFSQFYENICSNMNGPIPEIPEKKMLLDAREPCSGRTALGVCIEYKLDHFAFLLLAHGANPTIKNYLDLSPISYFNEYCKINNLNLKVDTAMGKVAQIIKASNKNNDK